MQIMRRGRAFVVVLAGLAVGAACGPGSSPPAGRALRAVADRRPAPGTGALVLWNEVALRATAAAPVDPPRESRTLAMVQGAVLEVVEEAFEDGGPSLEAAVACAAHDILVAVYPPQRPDLDDAERSALAGLPDGPRKDAGVAAGRRAAKRMLARRAADHADETTTYEPDETPGHWRPTPPALAPALDAGWGRVTPFALRRPSQFRPGAPYGLTSRTYSRDFAEIKAVGSAGSTVRTAEQTEAARFWTATAPQEWNQLVGQLVEPMRLSALDTARLFAELNVAEADAAIAAWDAKFHYGQWRPVTGIRDAGNDGNPRTTPDPEWTPLLSTPPFPDYVCGHSALAGAAQAVFERWFGPEPGLTLALKSAALPDVTHRYTTFRAIGDEVVNARVWGGVHWRTSCDVGRTLGRRIGDFVAQ